jgi:hypothetical protein
MRFDGLPASSTASESSNDVDSPRDITVTERSNAATEERLKSGHAVGGVSIV